jgi:hypothetical protein
MLDINVVEIAKDRIRLEITDQTENMHREISRIKSLAAANHSLQSGSTFSQIKELCILTIKNRAQMAWQTYFRFLTTAGISYSDTLADELKSMVAKHLPEGMFNNLMKETAELVRSPRLFSNTDLEQARKNALRKIGTEIDLFVYSLKTKTEIKDKESSIIQNFYAPVGAIQTGDSSIANVTQSIDTEVREQLRQVLDEISSMVSKGSIDLPYPKNEIIEIVLEGQEELKKESPNITKLRGMLSAVGTAIQTIASMKPAYEALKQALTYLGISLP